MESDIKDGFKCGEALLGKTVGGIYFMRFFETSPYYCFPHEIAFVTEMHISMFPGVISRHYARSEEDIIVITGDDRLSCDPKSTIYKQYQELVGKLTQIQINCPLILNGDKIHMSGIDKITLYPLSLAAKLLSHFPVHLSSTNIIHQVTEFSEIERMDVLKRGAQSNTPPSAIPINSLDLLPSKCCKCDSKLCTSTSVVLPVGLHLISVSKSKLNFLSFFHGLRKQDIVCDTCLYRLLGQTIKKASMKRRRSHKDQIIKNASTAQLQKRRRSRKDQLEDLDYVENTNTKKKTTPPPQSVTKRARMQAPLQTQKTAESDEIVQKESLSFHHSSSSSSPSPHSSSSYSPSPLHSSSSSSPSHSSSHFPPPSYTTRELVVMAQKEAYGDLIDNILWDAALFQTWDRERQDKKHALSCMTDDHSEIKSYNEKIDLAMKSMRLGLQQFVTTIVSSTGGRAPLQPPLGAVPSHNILMEPVPAIPPPTIPKKLSLELRMKKLTEQVSKGDFKDMHKDVHKGVPPLTPPHKGVPPLTLPEEGVVRGPSPLPQQGSLLVADGPVSLLIGPLMVPGFKAIPFPKPLSINVTKRPLYVYSDLMKQIIPKMISETPHDQAVIKVIRGPEYLKNAEKHEFLRNLIINYFIGDQAKIKEYGEMFTIPQDDPRVYLRGQQVH